ncbi:MAG TPA: hypothetical protein VHL09_11995 [Dehalococcoidia bacterium]|nr:hypothetical protein [Dehalococcoidia bacterium]
MPSIWWVNQGKTFAQEMAGGFLWAPLRDQRGRVQRHWETLAEVRAGDVIVHYARGAVRALSRARSAGRPARRPAGFLDAGTREDGRLVEVDVYRLAQAIPRDRVAGAIAALALLDGPVLGSGGVRQGYLWRFSPAGLRILRAASAEEWPGWAEAAWHAP